MPAKDNPKEQPVPLTQRLSLTLQECAALTGMTTCFFRRAIIDGELPFVRSGKGGRYLIRRETLEKFVRSCEGRVP